VGEHRAHHREGLPRKFRQFQTERVQNPPDQVVTGTVGTDGPSVRVPGLLILRIRDGLIVHCRDYMDALVLTEIPAA
jgi:ketosteroid isomerase-like protein